MAQWVFFEAKGPAAVDVCHAQIRVFSLQRQTLMQSDEGHEFLLRDMVQLRGLVSNPPTLLNAQTRGPSSAPNTQYMSPDRIKPHWKHTFRGSKCKEGRECTRGVRSRWSNCGVCPQLAGHEHLKQLHSLFLPPLSFPIVILIILEPLLPHPQLLNPLLLNPSSSLPSRSSSSFRPP
eukprot:1710044-Pyramimonas_sp.AAC.1